MGSKGWIFYSFIDNVLLNISWGHRSPVEQLEHSPSLGVSKGVSLVTPRPLLYRVPLIKYGLERPLSQTGRGTPYSVTARSLQFVSTVVRLSSPILSRLSRNVPCTGSGNLCRSSGT